MRYYWLIGVWVTVSAWGCATTAPRIPIDLGTQPPSAFGWNIGAADLLDPATGSCRLSVYLDELTAQGYSRQIRMIYTYEWGPQILREWMPIIRAHGYRVLVVLSQHPGDKDLVRLASWIQTGLPAIADVLDGVHLANEPDGYSGMTPTQYTDWHRQVAQMVRQVVPGVPILSPDFRSVAGANDWIARTSLDYGRDYDAISLHVTSIREAPQLQRDLDAIRRWTNRMPTAHLGGRMDGGQDLPDLPPPRTWITEGDWGQQAWFAAHGLPIERTYVYVYNGNEGETRRRDRTAVAQCGG